MASMNSFATSKVAFWCWGTFWSAMDLGCGTVWSPLDLGSSSDWADGEQSDFENLLRRVDYQRLSCGGAISPGGFREFGSGGHAMWVSVQLYSSGSGTLVVRIDMAWQACPRGRTSCWWFTLSSLMSDDKVDSSVSSLWWSPISRSVSSSYFIKEFWDIRYLQYDARRQRIGRQAFDGQQRLASFLNASALRSLASWSFCELLCLTWLGIGSICCNENRKLGNVGESV